MKKIILIILILLLIPFFIITIKDIDREEVNPTLTYNLTTTDSTYTDLNNHTLQEVFENESRLIGVGKNLCPTSSTAWEQGTLSPTTGLPTTSTVLLRTKDFIPKKVLTAYISSMASGYALNNIWLYDDNQNFITRTNAVTISNTSNSVYCKLVIEKSPSATIIPTDVLSANVQLELGSTATTYEVYKSTENNDSVPFVNWFNQSNFGLESLSSADLDAWYTIYQTYHTTYTTLTLGTATPTTYASLQQLILDNDGKDFKLYRDDVVDETRYRLTQEVGYISITNDDDLEIIRINDDDTFESSLQIDDTVDYKLVGYNVTSYIDGSFDNTILAFVWIIPILLIGGFFFVIFSHRKED